MLVQKIYLIQVTMQWTNGSNCAPSTVHTLLKYGGHIIFLNKSNKNSCNYLFLNLSNKCAEISHHRLCCCMHNNFVRSLIKL